MRLENLLYDLNLYELVDSLLADFVLAFAFFTSMTYAVLGRRFDKQRPAVVMSAAMGLALSTGLVWWERANHYSIRDLGPIAVGFAILLLAFVMYNAIRQVGGSWAGAGITLGGSILIAGLLQFNVPVSPEILQTVMVVALVIGLMTLFAHRRQFGTRYRLTEPDLQDTRKTMAQMYRDRHLSGRLDNGLRKLRKEAKTLHEHPDQATDVSLQIKRMLPAQGYLTERMAQLRAKAHSIRNGHIARLEETRHVFAKLPVSAKKKAAAELAAGYNQSIGIDTRLERLDKAVAENEKRIRQLMQQAQRYTANYEHQKLTDCLKQAEKLQHHNSRLFKTIERTENKLIGIAKNVVREVKQVNKE